MREFHHAFQENLEISSFVGNFSALALMKRSMDEIYLVHHCDYLGILGHKVMNFNILRVAIRPSRIVSATYEP